MNYQERVETIQSRRHARAEASCDRTLIYHLRRHSFYGLIGEADNRHRRRRGSVGVKAKVVGLDLVLGRPDAQWLATEDEKIDFFGHKTFVPAPLLPAKICRSKGAGERTARYFVEKFPLWITCDQGADYPSFTPVVSFAYVDPGPSRTEGFETFLKRYFLLFAALVRVRIVHASERPARGGPLGRGAGGSAPRRLCGSAAQSASEAQGRSRLSHDVCKTFVDVARIVSVSDAASRCVASR